MPRKTHQKMNEQINHELYSAYVYLSMSAYFEAEGLPGFARWMRLQSEEECAHSLKFFDFLGDVGAPVSLKAIDAPPSEFASPLDAFEQALKHERHVSALIHALCDAATEERDHPALDFLSWFVREQVEEEKSAQDAVTKLRRAGDAGPALLMLDKEMGARKEDED